MDFILVDIEKKYYFIKPKSKLLIYFLASIKDLLILKLEDPPKNPHLISLLCLIF